ncbi:MAG: dihydroorotate dehydrogenase [Candidatus Buchananbacteria bacterium RIFCSPHIGHO2_01_FULL_47_11b]|uniref:Dihydroorotate dehydrogenase n=1 Tax=Candidatus Buchananbacteria bacterium RIFCSPHIGHO2_01_FULL_47_11b TaxID=1797537 RepID=A0A1G1Y6W0_9BACT|nr:MAG: dihydroorotate dehydrogenase [Candidatus Buchananbacteria bacterium RIFCSPHIGHO2_01_FULL_47_11b]
MFLVDWFIQLNPILQAFLATLFTWGLTALGAAAVFFFRTINRRVLDAMLGFTGGVMIAASYWSLLAPAIEINHNATLPAWLPVAIGFLAGGIFFRIVDRLIPHLHLGLPKSEAEGPKTSWHRSVLLVLAITIHNIPEGLAIGVAFGAAAAHIPSATLAGAVALAVGIGIQNFPEGTAVAVPLRREGMSRGKAFWYGQLSAVVEPAAAVLGAAAVLIMQPILPYALAFAAGAMIFVVVEELIPESQRNGNTDLATLALLIGFTAMMTLDVAFR